MNVSELLAINEQTLAFEMVMKGKLQKEIDLAKEMLAELSKGKDILAVEKQNKINLDNFTQYKQSVEEEFVKEQKLLTDLSIVLKEKEDKLTLKEEILSTKERDILLLDKNKQRDFDSAVNAYKINMSNLKEDQRKLEEKEKELVGRETLLEQKLQALKAFSQ
jgi:hypothetical protein